MASDFFHLGHELGLKIIGSCWVFGRKIFLKLREGNFVFVLVFSIALGIVLDGIIG